MTRTKPTWGGRVAWALAALALGPFAGSAVRADFPARIAGEDVVTGARYEISPGAARLATVVAFLSSRCPCSASHEAALAALVRDFSDKGFRFVGVHSNQDEAPDLARGHFERSALPFPVLEDQGARLADAFGAFKTPHVFVLGPGGDVLFQGGVDDSRVHANARRHYLREALEALARGGRPAPAEARTLGCIIKR